MSMVPKLRVVPSKLESSHEQKCLGEVVLSWCGLHIPGLLSQRPDKVLGETTVISVITCLQGQRSLCCNLLVPLGSDSLLSAVCAVSLGVIRRLRPGQRDGFCHTDFRHVALLTFLKDWGRTPTTKISCTAHYVLKGAFMIISFHLPLI